MFQTNKIKDVIDASQTVVIAQTVFEEIVFDVIDKATKSQVNKGDAAKPRDVEMYHVIDEKQQISDLVIRDVIEDVINVIDTKTTRPIVNVINVIDPKTTETKLKDVKLLKQSKQNSTKDVVRSSKKKLMFRPGDDVVSSVIESNCKQAKGSRVKSVEIKDIKDATSPPDTSEPHTVKQNPMQSPAPRNAYSPIKSLKISRGDQNTTNGSIVSPKHRRNDQNQNSGVT